MTKKDGRTLRDEGMARALANSGPEWTSQILDFISSLPQGRELTGEEIRYEFLKEGGTKPATDKSWGGAINAAIKRGLLVGTGVYVPMKDSKSHSCKKQVLKVL